MTEEKKSQHREFVQAVITRMNTNSFQLKGLMITITAAFLGVYASSSSITENFLLIPVPLVILFWFLDAYYLQLERKFRGIYNDICDLNSKPKLTTRVFEMNPTLYKGDNYGFWKVFFKSPATAPLYLCVLISLITLYFYLKCNP